MDLRLTLSKVMSSIIDKIKNPHKPNKSHSLNNQEIEFLLYMIKEVNFRGENVELLYNVVSKLQQQYLDQKDK